MTDRPQTEDSILASSGDERFHAQLDLGGLGIYPKAYFEAAEILVGAVASGSNPDVIGYPLMYLYRHYLELMMKRIIELGRALDSNCNPQDYPDRHSLDVLWEEARPLIKKYACRPGQSTDDFDALTPIVEEFARHRSHRRGFSLSRDAVQQKDRQKRGYTADAAKPERPLSKPRSRGEGYEPR